jgi:hypothetical protein
MQIQICGNFLVYIQRRQTTPTEWPWLLRDLFSHQFASDKCWAKFFRPRLADS